MSTNTRPTGPARANAWVRHVEGQPSSGPTRPAMPEHYVIEFPDGSVVRAVPKLAGGPVPDCCDHRSGRVGAGCMDCLNTGHAHDPAEPCPPNPQTTPQDAREGGRNSLEEVPGGERTSQGADGASVRSLGDRLREQSCKAGSSPLPISEDLWDLAAEVDDLQGDLDEARGDLAAQEGIAQELREDLGAKIRLTQEQARVIERVRMLAAEWAATARDACDGEAHSGTCADCNGRGYSGELLAVLDGGMEAGR